MDAADRAGSADGRVEDWLAAIESVWPSADAEPWDQPGLQVGDPSAPVARVLVALDVTSAVVAEAAEVPHTLLVAHHPLLFRPLARVTPDTAAGRIALAAAASRVAVVGVHTNLDVAADGTGTSDPVAVLLGLDRLRPLAGDPRPSSSLRLTTFLPEGAVESALDALVAAGAGRIGAYERCAFEVGGTGRFRPGPGASPAVGGTGADVRTPEVRLEVVVPRGRASAAVAALVATHPYEQPVIDLVPLLVPVAAGSGPDAGGVRAGGLGLVGELDRPRSLGEVAGRVRSGLPAPHLRVAGDLTRSVSRVAVVGGSGGSLVPAAIAAGADLLVTGDVSHHVAIDALELGLAVIDAGHHATEVAAMPHVVARLDAVARTRGLIAPVLASSVSSAPWGSE